VDWPKEGSTENVSGGWGGSSDSQSRNLGERSGKVDHPTGWGKTELTTVSTSLLDRLWKYTQAFTEKD